MKQYLFGMVYSPGEGPVLFTHSAEAYPLYIRDLGMPLATATTWFFNGALSITWPSLLRAFKPQGAFSYCAVWNIIGWFLVLLFKPETNRHSLEELDQGFSVPTKGHAAWGLRDVSGFLEWGNTGGLAPTVCLDSVLQQVNPRPWCQKAVPLRARGGKIRRRRYQPREGG